MPKSKIDHAQALRDVRASWESRGYRADYLASRQYDKEDDQYGELAYQRAFAEAAKKDPPRLPNPSHYPNSPSAQTFLQKRNNAFFNNRPATDAPNPKYESPIPDYWRSKEESNGGNSQPTQQQYMAPPPPPPPPPPAAAAAAQQVTYGQTNGSYHAQSPSMSSTVSSSTVSSATIASSRTLPSPMEPKMGAPMGPPSRFR